MAGFSKVFSTIWGGSLYGHFEASAVFLVFLSLADRNGDVDMTPEAIAGTTGWPLDFIRKGIKELEAPDDRSRTPGHEGRRIIRTDDHRAWGWRITNYALYRDKMRSADRKEYLAQKQREYRARDKNTNVDTLTIGDLNQPIAEADTEAEANKKKTAIALPEWLDMASWTAWEIYRKEIGKKLTKSTITRQLNFLNSHRADHAAIINQSITSGWTGLFPLKASHENSKRTDNSAPSRVRRANEKYLKTG